MFFSIFTVFYSKNKNHIDYYINMILVDFNSKDEIHITTILLKTAVTCGAVQRNYLSSGITLNNLTYKKATKIN